MLAANSASKSAKIELNQEKWGNECSRLDLKYQSNQVINLNKNHRWGKWLTQRNYLNNSVLSDGHACIRNYTQSDTRLSLITPIEKQCRHHYCVCQQLKRQHFKSSKYSYGSFKINRRKQRVVSNQTTSSHLQLLPNHVIKEMIADLTPDIENKNDFFQNIDFSSTSSDLNEFLSFEIRSNENAQYMIYDNAFSNNIDYLKMHYSIAHMNGAPGKFQCQMCFKSFYLRIELEKHFEQMHCKCFVKYNY